MTEAKTNKASHEEAAMFEPPYHRSAGSPAERRRLLLERLREINRSSRKEERQIKDTEKRLRRSKKHRK